MKGRGHQQPGLARPRRDQRVSEDRVFISIARLSLQDKAVGGDAERLQQTRRGCGIAFAFQKHRARSATYYHLGVRVPPSTHRHLYEPITAAIQVVAAAGESDRTLQPAAKNDYSGNLLRSRCGPLEPLLQRV